MCMKPRLWCAETRFAKLCKVSKGFNWVCAKLLVGCADSRFAKPRTPFWKVLILFVRSRSCGELIRGSQNPELPARKRFYSFRLYEKNQKYPRGLRTSGLRGRFKSPLDSWVSAEMTGIHHVTGRAGYCSLSGYRR